MGTNVVIKRVKIKGDVCKQFRQCSKFGGGGEFMREFFFAGTLICGS